MKFIKSNFFFLLLIFIISLLFVLQLFILPGRPANFDSNSHITSIAQFSQILKHGEFPVIWMNNFANYGLPIGIFAHQITNYLGGLINILTNDPTISYNILVFLAIFLSNIFLYTFMRFYFSKPASFLATFIYCFTPYHIFNIYVRGAMPETFSGIFLPIILISLYLFIVRNKNSAFFLLALSITGLTLNHPMMLVVYSVIYVFYLFFLLLTKASSRQVKLKLLLASFFSMLLGLLMSSYYIIPLNLEIKYFYYGLIKNHITQDYYLSISNYLTFNWSYFTKSEIFPRGHIVQFGLIETLILIFGTLFLLIQRFIKNTKKNLHILYFALTAAIIAIFFTTKFSDIFFQRLFFLNSIQFPWRFLSSLIFIPPIIAAYLYNHFPKKIVFFLVIFLVALFAFPQLYGKNVNVYPNSSYYFSKENAHSVQMNTIWTGKSEDYPDKINQYKIIQGQGKIYNAVVKNSSRNYLVSATTPLRIEDLTFYFPGWTVYIDGIKTNIEFQNPDYRGVITYVIPAGNHNVMLKFEDTKVRFLGKIISVISLLIFAALFLLRKHLNRFLL